MAKVERKSKNPSDRERIRDEFEARLVDLARVTRVTEGGKQMSFRACVVVGDRKGKLGEATKKGADVSIAIDKATRAAKKNLIEIVLKDGTIPYQIKEKCSAAKIILKPAPKGTGIKAGGSMRVVLELAGVENVISKMLGSRNKISNVRATINALKKLSDLAKNLPKKEKVLEVKKEEKKEEIKK